MNERFDIPSAALIHYKEIDREHQALVDVLNSLTRAFGKNDRLSGALFYEHAMKFQHASEHHSQAAIRFFDVARCLKPKTAAQWPPSSCSQNAVAV
jgi:hypothetical protein